MINDVVITDLAVKRNETQVLQGISFHVKKHEMIAVIGPNGGGKTTLLKALLGLVPYTGSVQWNETVIRYLPPLDHLQRKELPPLTIEDFFNFKRSTSSRIDALLTHVGLDPALRSRQFTTLSTGEFQRMLIAWTLLEKPEVIVLDEPTAGLDMQGEHMIFSFLKSLKNLTVLIATHHVHSALEYSDTILCINKEQLCFGPPSVVTMATIKMLYGASVHYDHR